jgi:hypothetical protein
MFMKSRCVLSSLVGLGSKTQQRARHCFIGALFYFIIIYHLEITIARCKIVSNPALNQYDAAAGTAG